MAAEYAYDFARFEPKAVETRPQLKVVERKAPVKQILGFRPITLVVGAMLVLAVVALLLYNNALLCEIGASITDASGALEKLQNEYITLTNQLEVKTSNIALAETAVQQLGLVELESDQVEYITLHGSDVVTVQAAKPQGAAAAIGQAVERLQEYLR